MTIIKGLQARLMKDVYHSALAKKGYVFFDNNTAYNLNIIGVRRVNGAAPNKFDDTMVVVYRNKQKFWEVFTTECTTDPGLYWLEEPMNVDGTAILVPGQYRSVYRRDLHLGKYEALCQRGAEVSVYRDGNRDRRHDMDPSTTDTGYFGINIHKAGRASTQVDKWSAGCQVISRSDEFATFMDLTEEGAERHGNSFTYTLLLETDFS